MVEPVFQAPNIPTPNETKVNTVPEAPKMEAKPEAVQESAPAQSVPEGAQPVPPQPAVAQEAPTEVPQASAQVNQLKEQLAKVDIQGLRQKLQSHLWVVLGGCFLLGLMFGCSMGGGKSQPVQPKQAGMERYIIANKDIQSRSKYKICGKGNLQTESCLFYVLNSYPYDKKAEDFFKLVEEQSHKDQYYIRQVNPITAQIPVPAGHFIEILVPATR